MSWVVEVARETPDGLDPVFEAYKCLKKVFEAAEVIKIDEGERGIYYMLRLPGSGEVVDPDDLNPLSGLEDWLAQEVARRSIEE